MRRTKPSDWSADKLELAVLGALKARDPETAAEILRLLARKDSHRFASVMTAMRLGLSQERAETRDARAVAVEAEKQETQ